MNAKQIYIHMHSSCLHRIWITCTRQTPLSPYQRTLIPALSSFSIFQIVKASHSLDMEVRHVGRIPGSLETHQSYTWVDEFGRTVSPPPEVDQSGRYNTTDGRKSGLMLLKDTDERKVRRRLNY